MKLAVLFGSSSNEHEVSVISASSVIMNLDKKKYDIIPIYLDKENRFYVWKEDVSNIRPLPLGVLPNKLEVIEHPFSYLKQFDLLFIMVHGKNGEDGILASIFDFLKIPYVGNDPVGSAITMDKIITKDILEYHGVRTAPYFAFTKYGSDYVYHGESYSLDLLMHKIESQFSFPLFVKPSNSGSSIGINKVKEKGTLEAAIKEALTIDDKILVEEMVSGKELECAILEVDGEVRASVVGEIVAAEEFYSFDAKYNNEASKTIIPADISEQDAIRIKEVAIRAFKILNLHGYSRIDFFLTDDHQVILNEINTIPGFTEISMYPKLWEASGVKYRELLDLLISSHLKK